MAPSIFTGSCHIDPGIGIVAITGLFNQVGQLKTSSHLQLRPGEDKAKQCMYSVQSITQLQFLKHTYTLYHFKVNLVVNPTNVSDFKYAFQQKHYKRLC